MSIPLWREKKSATHQVFLHVHSVYLNELFTKTWGVDTLEVKTFLPSSGYLVQLQILRTLQAGDKGKSYKAARNEARLKTSKTGSLNKKCPYRCMHFPLTVSNFHVLN